MRSSTTDSPVWFITGCSSGFGREFVRAALAHGFRVLATARDPKKLGDLIAGREDKAKVLALDVTNADQIKGRYPHDTIAKNVYAHSGGLCVSQGSNQVQSLRMIF